VRRLGNRLPHGWRAVAWIGVLVGVAAALSALPPITIRSPVVPVVIGLFAFTIGLGSWIRGERRIGGYAMAAGFIGIFIGYLATRSSVGNLETVVVWGALFGAALRYATPLLFASLGGLFSERSGVVNIGLEGMMLTGAFFAIWGADVAGHWALGLLIGVLAGGAFGLLHAFFSVTLRADQIVGGTAINLIALGLTTYLFIKIYGDEGTPTGISAIPNVSIGFFDEVPGIGGFLDDVFGDLNLMIWAGFVLVPESGASSQTIAAYRNGNSAGVNRRSRGRPRKRNSPATRQKVAAVSPASAAHGPAAPGAVAPYATLAPMPPHARSASAPRIPPASWAPA